MHPIRRASSARSYHGDGFCDAPPFDLGLDLDDDPPVAKVDEPNKSQVTSQEAGLSKSSELDDWDSETVREVCAAADKVVTGKAPIHIILSDSLDEFHTPDVTGVLGGASGSGSTTSDPPMQKRTRRIIKPTVVQRSPYIDYNKTKTFTCNEQVNKLHVAVLYYVRNLPGTNATETR